MLLNIFTQLNYVLCMAFEYQTDRQTFYSTYTNVIQNGLQYKIITCLKYRHLIMLGSVTTFLIHNFYRPMPLQTLHTVITLSEFQSAKRTCYTIQRIEQFQ